jgi:hypothetical protein
MGHDVDHDALVRPAGQGGDQDQMAGGRDRKKFGDALDEGENDDLLDRHAGIPIVPSPPQSPWRGRFEALCPWG